MICYTLKIRNAEKHFTWLILIPQWFLCTLINIVNIRVRIGLLLLPSIVTVKCWMCKMLLSTSHFFFCGLTEQRNMMCPTLCKNGCAHCFPLHLVVLVKQKHECERCKSRKGVHIVNYSKSVEEICSQFFTYHVHSTRLILIWLWI